MQGKTRPFDPSKEPSSLKAYFGTAQRFLSYFSRVAVPDEYRFSPAAGDDGNKERPEDIIQPTNEQLTAWQDISRMAKQRCANLGTRSDGDDDDDDDNDDDDDGKNSELKERLLELWSHIIWHTTDARRYESLLLSFCAMLSIKPSTKSWMEPGNFNSSFSAIIWVSQSLLFYDSALKEQRGCGKMLKLVKFYCDQYLEQRDTDGRDPQMASVVVQSVGQKRRGSRSVLGRTRRGTDLRGHRIADGPDPLFAFIPVPGMLSAPPRRLTAGPQESPSNEQTPFLKDGVNVDIVRWNFTQYRDNATIFGGTETALTRAIERSEQLRRIFIFKSSQSPGEWAWRESAMASYEATEQEFLKRLSVLIHISGGQRVRESEFFPMTSQHSGATVQNLLFDSIV